MSKLLFGMLILISACTVYDEDWEKVVKECESDGGIEFVTFDVDLVYKCNGGKRGRL